MKGLMSLNEAAEVACPRDGVLHLVLLVKDTGAWALSPRYIKNKNAARNGHALVIQLRGTHRGVGFQPAK